jgi:hypothetical protein
MSIAIRPATRFMSPSMANARLPTGSTSRAHATASGTRATNLAITARASMKPAVVKPRPPGAGFASWLAERARSHALVHTRDLGERLRSNHAP